MLTAMVWMCGCGDPAPAESTTTALPDVAGLNNFSDIAGDAQESADAVPDLATLDVSQLPDLGAEVKSDAAAPDTASSPGCGGCTCSENSQCDSGLCLETDDGKFCTKLCVGGCPTGYKCTQLSLPGADLAEHCVPAYPRICEPCTADSDCNNIAGGADSRCIPYVDPSKSLVGNFCAVSCKTSDNCPGGYSCEERTSVGGVKSKQCVRADLVCPCDKRATQLELSTTCSNAGDLGTCSGKRTCGKPGLSTCNAPKAVEETCNLTDDDCDGQTDEPGPGVCDDGQPCTYDNCIAGACQHPTFAGKCDDKNPCTTDDVCTEGKCGGKTVTCDDKNPCTKDTCGAAGTCVFAPSDGADCEDGSVCTGGDKCNGSVCLPGAATACDDKNPCTTDTCDPIKGCQYPPNTLPCSDGDICTMGDVCKDGACVTSSKLPCNDGNPCTDDSCDPQKGCLFVNNTKACDDYNSCTTGETCADGACVPAAASDCDDKNPCTTETCDPKTGCKAANNTAPCNDGDMCSVGDVCAGGACKPGPLQQCSDGNPCTDDKCDGQKGCVQTPNVGPCQDGSVCTVGDACSGGICVPGKYQSCADGNDCTLDSCDSVAGCQHVNGSAPCDDGSVCTLGDKCAAGTCASGKTISCDDGNPCTDNGCDIQDGCQNVFNEAPCSDGTACTAGDACSQGKCISGPVKNCDDGNACTDDVCDPKVGCVNKNNVAACSDGSVCTGGDACSLGLCIAGAKIPCNDGNPCTDDSCDPQKGCVFAPNNGACDDGNGCTGPDKCAAGACKPAGGCDVNATCTLVVDTLKCVCKAGLNGDGFTCTDVDECANGTAKCGNNTVCQNTPGSYLCTCKSGWADCNSNAGDGCETDIASTPGNCGGCGVVCSATNIPSPVCVGGKCLGACASGTDDCNGDKQKDGCEVKIASDNQNCGKCGNICGGGLACSASNCVPASITVNFTSCGATGPKGPTQAQCDATYGPGVVSVASGIQVWTVPFTATYRITALGAQGGGGGGAGASVTGDLQLTAGTVLRILVGQVGLPAAAQVGNGGGGGSYVVGPGNTPLIIAGGGGGTGHNNSNAGYGGIGGQAGNNGQAGQYGNPGTGGVGGNGGGMSNTTGNGTPNAGGGGGMTGDGAGAGAATGGKSFVGGGVGGDSTGGFGGGAGSNLFIYGCGSSPHGGGGGGGYSGGGGGGDNCNGAGGGGGSFNAGQNPSWTTGANAAAGKVTIKSL